MEWRDEFAAKSVRQADYAWTVLSRILSVALKRGKIDASPCAGGEYLYQSNRIDRIWTFEEEQAFLRYPCSRTSSATMSSTSSRASAARI
jgi:hypothetical protein